MGRKKNIVSFSVTKHFLEKIGGSCAVDLVKICETNTKGVTDETIGKKLPLKITEIRTILNRLHFRGIACYQKTRNNKTGWYSYTWEIKPKRIAELVIDEQAEELDKMEGQINFEGDHTFFVCKQKHDMLAFEVAAEYNFCCPVCGGAMNPIDNKTRLKTLKKKFSLVKKELSELKKYL